ncbi:MAG: barstar family protein [Clostridia bacterium]|nr:barstar family protein [Clostridia bacterium]
MKPMKIIELDLTGCKTLGELHERIRVAFDFPEWYGKNWDAFHDLLRTECDADKVVVKGINTISSKFAEDINLLSEILKRKTDFNKMCNFNDFSYEII